MPNINCQNEYDLYASSTQSFFLQQRCDRSLYFILWALARKYFQFFEPMNSGKGKVDNDMSEELDPKETATFEEVLMGNVFTQEALIELMEKKWFVTREELLKEINWLRQTHQKASS